MPASISPCEMAPVPAPSSITCSPGAQRTASVTARASTRDDGITAPIDLGERSHCRKNSSVSLVWLT